jgi:hypothetical protein
VPVEDREPPGHHQGVEAEGGHQVLTTLKQICNCLKYTKNLTAVT